MAGLPTVTVLLDDGTGTFPYNVSSYVRLVNGISMTHGRGDEQGAIQPSTLSLTFDNQDGRFTLGSTTIASPSPIQVNQRIRVRLTVSGTTVDRFTGYVQEWPVAWPSGGQEFSTVTITATDALARMGRVPTGTPLEDVMLLDGATAVWPLTDPDPAIKAGQVGPGCFPVGPSAEDFGPLYVTGKYTSGSFADTEYLEFASQEMPNDNGSVIGLGPTALSVYPYYVGQTLGGVTSTSTSPNISASSNYSVEIAFKLPPATSDSLTTTILQVGADPDGSFDYYVVIFASYNEFSKDLLFSLRTGPLGADYAEISVPGTWWDGEWHFATAAISNSGQTMTAYVDGVPCGSTSTTGTVPVGTLDSIRVGKVSVTGGTDPWSAGYVAVYPSTLTAGQAAAHAEVAVGSTGFRSDEIVERYAAIANVPFTAIDDGSSMLPMFAGSDSLSVTSEVMKAERGRLYVNGSGTLTFESREENLPLVYAGTPSITVTVDLLNADATFSVDTQGMANRVEVTRTGGATTVVEDSTSITQHGVYGSSESVQVLTDSDAGNLAAYLLWLNKDPSSRLAGARLDLMTQSTAIQQSFLTNLMGAWLQTTGLPSQAPTGATADLYIEGWTEVINLTDWSLDLNTSPKRETATTWWRLDDANFDLGVNTRLYY